MIHLIGLADAARPIDTADVESIAQVLEHAGEPGYFGAAMDVQCGLHRHERHLPTLFIRSPSTEGQARGPGPLRPMRFVPAPIENYVQEFPLCRRFVEDLPIELHKRDAQKRRDEKSGSG